MRILRVIVSLIAVVVMFFGLRFWMLAKDHSASLANTQSTKDIIEDYIDIAIVRAMTNMGEDNPAAFEARTLQTYFHENFVATSGYRDDVGFHASAQKPCRLERCDQFVVFPFFYPSGKPVLAIYRGGPKDRPDVANAIIIHPELNLEDPYTPYRVLEQIYYAKWEADNGRSIPVFDPTSEPHAMPWEDSNELLRSRLLDATTNGAYAKFIVETSREMFAGDSDVVRTEHLTFVDMPEELFTDFFREAITDTGSRSQVLQMATLDLNRVLINENIVDPTERSEALNNLFYYFATESHDPEVTNQWRRVVKRTTE